MRDVLLCHQRAVPRQDLNHDGVGLPDVLADQFIGQQTFRDFWPFYVGEHKDPMNRALHYAGTTMVLGTVAAAAITLNPTWLLLAPVVGYGPAWVGHFFIEKNKPASFTYPLWSLRGDFKMYALFLRGKMAEEVERVCREREEPAGRAAQGPNGARVDTHA